MNLWLGFVIIGQFLNAAVVLVDRYIVATKVVSKPIVYTFYVSVLSIWTIVVLPFGITLPNEKTLVLSFVAAVSYVLSIYFLFESLKSSNPSEVVPVIGGVAALTAFLGSKLMLDVELPDNFIAGFIVLTAGMLLISHFRFTGRSFVYLTGSGVFFGLSTVVIKAMFDSETFMNGFFWSRMANVGVAIILLAIPGISSAIGKDLQQPKRQSKTMYVIGNKMLAGLAFLCILIAIKYGNVAMVNALTATQYVFLLIFALFFTRLLPEYFSETIHRHEFLHKMFATGLIVVGFFILFI